MLHIFKMVMNIINKWNSFNSRELLKMRNITSKMKKMVELIAD